MSLPRGTAELPGCGGALKSVPEDFQVTELPAYEPSGEGEHLYLWIEKVGQDTAFVARRLGQLLGFPEGDVGYAGLKDRQARTFQYFSVPARAEAKLALFEAPGVTIHRSARHGNKLKTGHLKGNHFEIRVRGPTDAQAADAVAAVLRSRGLPNYFGGQRFGRADDNAALGKRLLLGERLPQRIGRFERKLFLSAYQSLLFNRALAQRVAEASWTRALSGDVLRKADSGGVFVCEAPDVDQPRVDAFEVSPAGPLFGPKMVPASGGVATAEAALLAEEQVTSALFEKGGGETQGGRRAYRLAVPDLAVTREGGDLIVAVTLPKGSYATVLLDELMKSNAAGQAT